MSQPTPDKTTTHALRVDVPKWVKAEHFKTAAKVYAKTMKELGQVDNHHRGYILAANHDGFPIKAGLATGRTLFDISTRAFWWSFERITRGEVLPHERK